MARALRAWAINRRRKISACNLRYGLRTRLVRGIYVGHMAVSQELGTTKFAGLIG